MSWPTVPLASAFEFIRNGMSVKQDSGAGGLPITRIETISDGTVNPLKVGFAGLGYPEATRWMLEPGDILFSHINSFEHVGKCAVYRGEPAELVHGMNLLCFRSARTKLNPEYAKHLLRSKAFRAQLERLINKAVRQASVSIGNLSDIPISLPPLEEQRRIAETLDKADELRAKRRDAITLLDHLPQSIFLEMFGDPVSNPMKWPVEKLTTLGSLDRGVSKHRPRNAPELLGGNHPLIQTGDVANSDGYIRSHTSTYSDLGLRQSRKWPRGTLCITIAANIAKTGILTFDACFPDSVVGFKAHTVESTQFVRVWLSFLQKTLEDSAPESAQKNINLEILRNLPVPVPPAKLQSDFKDRVEAIYRAKALQTSALSELTDLFAALQIQLLDGAR